MNRTANINNLYINSENVPGSISRYVPDAVEKPDRVRDTFVIRNNRNGFQ